ncbi:ABC transporter ATP-binding protein [Berryella wangjianweii]|uniref:ABC transporter ATP-binding protein n=1 Tax=Berryella wangjianweii TaxID=2734634 RepID=A0A6M8J7B1_9ACTN|nr:ABC transporter ATP-binding protein [Berryella wangjianweii]QKF07289.1 ABC transporter ATP-binding protein [Berryella wangjianweii]
MASNVFTITDVSFSFGCNKIFDGLSLQIPEGQVTTLIGANGSGKTTLFNLMCKNLRPAAGTVFLRGANVADLRLRDFAKLVAIVHQNNTAPYDLTVEQLVAYGRFPHQPQGPLSLASATERAKVRAEDEHMVAWAIDVCDLSEVACRTVASLSGGQRQRVWIAMALAQGSKVLLLDEPTTYLDVKFQLDILRLVRRLNEEFGITVVMVLHDINQALRYSDRIVALADGAIACQGAPEEVVDADLIERVYDVRLDVVQVQGRPFIMAV